VNCQGSLLLIDGGAVSFGCSSNVPAATEPMSADAVPANKNKSNFHVPSFSERPSDLAGGVAVIADDFGVPPATRLWDFPAMFKLVQRCAKKIGLPIKGGRFTN
jgi:hypothetical protein